MLEVQQEKATIAMNRALGAMLLCTVVALLVWGSKEKRDHNVKKDEGRKNRYCSSVEGN